MSIFNARWISEKSGCEAPVFRKKCTVRDIKSAVIDICGLGWFELYINGKPASENVFEPAVATYEQLNGKHTQYPIRDIFTNPRVYFCRYDITALLKDGENLLSAQLGNGWFNQTRVLNEGTFYIGVPRLAFSVRIETGKGETLEIESGTDVKAGKSQIVENNVYYGEKHDLHLTDDFHDSCFSEKNFDCAVEAKRPDGELTLFDYPAEKVIRRIIPKYIGTVNGKKLYDLGENITGRLKFDTSYGGKIIIEHAEELNPDRTLDFYTVGCKYTPWRIQTFECIGDALPHKDVYAHFTWYGFRYFTVEGEIENLVCEVIHTDIKRTSDFKCGNEVLNGLYDIYIRTQLNNIHGCVPSDCPHRERFGYTGDGQITCETAMHVFDVREMYKKWMRDIIDCQDVNNGHVQHTAPFFGGGGGPSGWGGAVIVLPYQYYKFYGDDSLVKKCLPNMLHYLSYMESRCENAVVVREENGGWFTGDWAYIEEGNVDKDGVAYLTPQFVNTCYLIKFYDRLLELDSLLKLGLEREALKRKREAHASAVVEKYYDEATGDFCRGFLAANAYALDIGLGDERTLNRLVEKYDGAGGFDTGIFGTEILVRVLAERRYDDAVFKLLSSRKEKRSFGYMLDSGATTLWEYWDGKESHCHPMFGGCVKTLFTTFLGIRAASAGYRTVEISPCDIEALGDAEGYITTLRGKISVAIKRRGNGGAVTVELPDGVGGTFRFRGLEAPLEAGKKVFEF